MKQLQLSQVKKQLEVDISQGALSYRPEEFRKYGNVIDWNVNLSNGISLQRPFCWTLYQKQQLIISLLKGIRIPNLTILIYDLENTSRTRICKIIDGKQRLSTILDFIDNKFQLEVDNELYYFSEISKDCQESLTFRHILCDVSYEYEDKRVSDKGLIEWFEQINFSGTSQDIEHLDNLKLQISYEK